MPKFILASPYCGNTENLTKREKIFNKKRLFSNTTNVNKV